MNTLIVALGAFVLTHLIPAVGPVRMHLIRSMGTRIYLAFHSAISLAVIVWLTVAYSEAPYLELWPQWSWTRWAPVVVMPVACVLLVGALTAPNPLSLAVMRGAYDPARPGIVSVTRHPLMWALILWAAAHLLPNGDAASVLVFGVFLALGLLGIRGLDAKARDRLGAVAWERQAAVTACVPFAAALAGRQAIDWAGIGWARAVTGLLLYGALLFGHPYVIGVSPLP